MKWKSVCVGTEWSTFSIHAHGELPNVVAHMSLAWHFWRCRNCTWCVLGIRSLQLWRAFLPRINDCKQQLSVLRAQHSVGCFFIIRVVCVCVKRVLAKRWSASCMSWWAIHISRPTVTSILCNTQMSAHISTYYLADLLVSEVESGQNWCLMRRLADW